MDEYEVISIPVSDGTEKEFAIMDTFTVEGKSYMALFRKMRFRRVCIYTVIRMQKTEILLWSRLRNPQSISEYPKHMKQGKAAEEGWKR